jgi:TatA/E family protein of Tat protein translocase
VFNLGFTEMAVIFVVALLVFGPNKLPELARNLGKSLAEFRRASNDLRRSIMEADATPPTPRPPQGPADEVAAAAFPEPLATLPHSVPNAGPIPAPAAAPPASATSAKPGEPNA